MSDPTLSDIHLNNKMAWVWTTLNPTIYPQAFNPHLPLFQAVLTSSRRSWRKRLIRFVNRYYAGVYPARAETYALALAIFLGFDKGANIDLSRGYVQLIEEYLPTITGMGGKHYVAASLFTGVVWVGIVLVVRYILKERLKFRVNSKMDGRL